MVRTWFIALAAALGLGLAAAGSAETTTRPAVTGAGACAHGRAETGDLGIGMFQCLGGECAVNVLWRGGYVHEFSTEPRVWHLQPGSPAAAALREGDFILAVDGALVTTLEGGRRLANLRPGIAVQLRIRRGRQELAVSLSPVPGCNAPRLVVTAGPTDGPPPN